MNTLRRYLGVEVSLAIVLVLAALLALLAFFDLMHEVGDLGRGTYQLKQMAAYVLLSIPGRVQDALPIAVLIGTLFALAHLVSTSEYLVLRTSGLSLPRFCGALLATGVVFALAILVFEEVIAPPLQELAQRHRSQALAGVVAQEFRSGLWVKDGRTFVNVGAVTHDARLERIVVYEFDAHNGLRKLSVARDGGYSADHTWTLNDVSTTSFDAARATVRHSDHVQWTSVLEPRLLSMLMIQPADMSIGALYSYSEFLKQNHQNADRYLIALWTKLVSPFAVLVMMLLALAFAQIPVRTAGGGARIVTGIMLGLLFTVLNRLFGTLVVLCHARLATDPQHGQR